MEEVYWGLLITFLGAAFSLIKDWKLTSEKWYNKSNLLTIIGFAIIMAGGIKSCSFSSGTLAEKLISDSLANARQNAIIRQGKEIIGLNGQLSDTLKSQLDTTIKVLNLSRELNKVQNNLYNYFFGDGNIPGIHFRILPTYVDSDYYEYLIQVINNGEYPIRDLWLEVFDPNAINGQKYRKVTPNLFQLDYIKNDKADIPVGKELHIVYHESFPAKKNVELEFIVHWGVGHAYSVSISAELDKDKGRDYIVKRKTVYGASSDVVFIRSINTP